MPRNTERARENGSFLSSAVFAARSIAGQLPATHPKRPRGVGPGPPRAFVHARPEMGETKCPRETERARENGSFLSSAVFAARSMAGQSEKMTKYKPPAQGQAQSS